MEALKSLLDFERFCWRSEVYTVSDVLIKYFEAVHGETIISAEIIKGKRIKLKFKGYNGWVPVEGIKRFLTDTEVLDDV